MTPICKLGLNSGSDASRIAGCSGRGTSPRTSKLLFGAWSASPKSKMQVKTIKDKPCLPKLCMIGETGSLSSASLSSRQDNNG